MFFQSSPIHAETKKEQGAAGLMEVCYYPVYNLNGIIIIDVDACR